ncbi:MULTISPECIES: hypothetical protein [Frankia]|uniref:Uncharacterized protein n=1 Tax=Frankia alni (strain DSM 45986 / CECT 9034 / ACN14a) TaxID=326424 RepID=Q0RSB8_FRAAA|nr:MULTISPECIES: hypothetical protein [Frankia]CAJ59546.1 hypothetical protein FRAAL0878 [Frankia alni ACN14a]
MTAETDAAAPASLAPTARITPTPTPTPGLTSALDEDDLLIVAEPDDAVASFVAEYLDEVGRRAVVLDPFHAAQLFTVAVSGRSALVTPRVPMLLRVPPPPVVGAGARPDAQFQYQECVALLWAAAALTDLPVVNRPSVVAFGSAVSGSAALTDMAAGQPVSSIEVFSSTYPDPARQTDEAWWVQDAVTRETARWPQPPAAGGPFRARWSAADPVFEVVVVLAGSAWRCTTAEIDDLDLPGRSLAVVERLGLTLAALIWRVGDDGGSAHLVDVDPFPGLDIVRMTWLGLGPHLLTVLFPGSEA